MQISDAASQAFKDEKRRRQKKTEAGEPNGSLTAFLPDMKGFHGWGVMSSASGSGPQMDYRKSNHNT